MTSLTPRIDHVVVYVDSDLDAAAERYRRLGFQLTGRGHHTLGTSNHLAVFGSDYLELIGFEPGKAELRPEMASLPLGLAGLVFKPPADPEFAAALNAAGVPTKAPSEFSRPVDLPGGPQTARFRTVDLPGVLQNGRVFFCHHHTPELVWRAAWQHHPNQVLGIGGVTIASPEPASTAAPFERMFPAEAFDKADTEVTLRTGAARIRFVHPALLEAEYGDALTAYDEAEDRMVALEFRTASLASVRGALDQAGIVPTEVEGKLTVAAADAFGVALTFVPQAAGAGPG